jgi:hypothetical protein
MNTQAAVVTHSDVIVDTASSAETLAAQVQLIQRAMAKSMIEGVHYGKIPGTPKPTLFKSGAEKLGLLFHIGPHYRVEEISAGDAVRYRLHCIGRHQNTGLELGEGVGECSSDEQKYRWRTPVCAEEFEETALDRRREKWTRGSGGGNAFKLKQVRTESVDIANTVLKMAAKRAHIAMILNVTAASDIFSQDLEELPDELIGDMAGQSPPQSAQQSSQQRPPPQQQPRGTGRGGFITEPQVKYLRAKIDATDISAEDVCNHFSIDSLTKLPFATMDAALKFIAAAHRKSGDEPPPAADAAP